MFWFSDNLNIITKNKNSYLLLKSNWFIQNSSNVVS